eukprot:CAMPEP_0172795316 /NCGR_PEP_ID=MMETSP1074-20121228/210423_1 /TAXON_ID=2916 /ORGANISM="Ceratium fusus, Strain PA161109" /LENGTH=241 /DNA_ID=CAMNT_0013632403 /DNA_START=279 /DNA_END=1000 /DNA_ORIENTATION=-
MTDGATTVLRLAVRLLAIRSRHAAGKMPLPLLSDEDGGGGSWKPAPEEDVIHDGWADVEELAPCGGDAVQRYCESLPRGRSEELEGGSNAVRLLIRAPLMEVHGCQMTCNSMTLPPEEQVRRAMRSRQGGTWADFGVALYPSGAMLNHSCSPTCLWFVRGGVLIVETVKPVKRGEELTIPYLPMCGSTVDRRNRIKKVFGFHCLCCRCSTSDERGRATTTRKRLREPPRAPDSGTYKVAGG